MSSWSRARRLARSTAARSKRYALRTRPVRRVVRPDISVIVPFYNVEQYIEACLRSIQGQAVSNIEVLLVDDGSRDGSRAIAEEFIRHDHRFRLVTRPNGGLGAARNTGIPEARGRYLTFVDSDDELTPNSLRDLFQSAETTGSDIVMGSVQRFDSTSSWAPGWVDSVHKHRRTGVRAEDFLPILRNLYTWNKLFRRDFWDAQGLWFREGVSYEDQPIITQLFVAASSIDVIPTVVYRYRARDDRSSISQQTGTIKDLRDRVAAWRATQAALRGTAETVRTAWLQTLFDAHFIWYLASSGTEEDEFWSLLQAVIAELVDEAPRQVWDAAPATNRVLLELARTNRRADVQEYVRLEGMRDLRAFDSEVREDGIHLCLPFHEDPTLPDELFLIRPEQMSVHHVIDRIRRVEGDVEVTGWAHVSKIDLSNRESRVSLVLRDEETGEEQVVPAVVGVPPRTPCPEGDDWCDYSPGAFTARIPLTALRGAALGVRIRVEVANFTVEEVVTRLVRRGPLGNPAAIWLPGGDRLLVSWRNRQPLVLERHPTRLRATELTLDGRTLSGRLVGPDAATASLRAQVGDLVVTARLGANTPQGRDFVINLPVPPRSGGAMSVWRFRSGSDADVVLEDSASLTDRGTSTLVVGPDRSGSLRATDWREGVLIESVTCMPDGRLRIEGTAYGEDVSSVRLGTANAKVRSRQVTVPVRDGAFVADLELTQDVYRFGVAPLPSGEHQLRVELRVNDAWAGVGVVLAPQLVEELPIPVVSDVHQGSVRRGPDGGCEIGLPRPFAGEGNRYHQAKARRAAQSTRGTAVSSGILFRSYFGEKATDNGVAIQAELARRGSDLPVYWAVQDSSVVVPEGGIPVVVNSPEWFRLISTVTYYVDNMYQPEYHLKPDGQVFVETFHGYPFKQMGRPHWEKQQFSREKIESYGQRSAEWDFLLSPATYATPLLMRDFGFHGPVLEIGYPRNDVLLSARADDIRAATRASLGIRDDQLVVLYAPTFRDYLAKNDNRAAMSDFFDFDQVAEEFGEEVIVLTRGHAFHARTRQRIGTSGTTIDVTDYPEVSDLYLATDAAVVDYSSLRFDFGVTGKPMIFLVPDLQRYVETRGWLFDFEPTAPGPLVSTTAEVIDHLRDLRALQEKYAGDYAIFRTTFLDLEDGHAAERFVDAVIAPRGDA